MHRSYFGRLSERLGALPPSLEPTAAGSIWLHAVSVGEVISAVDLVKRLKTRAGISVYVSTTTIAGREIAAQKLAPHADGIFFAPLDYAWIVRRVLRRLKPALVVVLETEIWPNLYRESKRAGASLVVVNGRISDRTFPRYRRFAWFFRHVLAWPDAILAQSENIRQRYLALGAPADRVREAGNLKFDFEPASGRIPEDLAGFLDRAAPACVWIAASTMPPRDSGDVDEDDVVIEAFHQIAARFPGLLLILVPRRPERFEPAAQKLMDAGIPFVRRSRLDDRSAIELRGVLLLDSVGELAPLFERADVVFMGGSLARRGGHNILEPAFYGKPIIVGPHMENFAAIADEFKAASAMSVIGEASALAPAVISLLESPVEARKVGDRARDLALSKRGVTSRLSDELWRWYEQGQPRPAGRLIARSLAALWSLGLRRSQSARVARARELPRPVISVGAIAAGGAGKTPMVEWLAKQLTGRGYQPAILTRGYGRRFPDQAVVVPRGNSASADRTGDEAQLLVRSGHAHVGIGADRARTGQILLDRLQADLFLLDDGFQHRQLHRRLDLVLIDALDPFAGGALLPHGRLREPPESLARADAIVITRADWGAPVESIERRIRKYNPHAPVFHSRVVPQAWVEHERGFCRIPTEPPARRAAAFCGLGNPRAFWRALEQLELDIVFRWTFGDHHRYRPMELKRIAAQAIAHGAGALLTTGKDAVNLCANVPALIAPLALYRLEIGIEIDRQDELLALVEERMAGS